MFYVTRYSEKTITLVVFDVKKSLARASPFGGSQSIFHRHRAHPLRLRQYSASVLGMH